MPGWNAERERAKTEIITGERDRKRVTVRDMHHGNERGGGGQGGLEGVGQTDVALSRH